MSVHGGWDGGWGEGVGYPWYQVPSRRIGFPRHQVPSRGRVSAGRVFMYSGGRVSGGRYREVGGRVCPTRSRGHCYGGYASYWNTFLFHIFSGICFLGLMVVVTEGKHYCTIHVLRSLPGNVTQIKSEQALYM